MPNLHHRAHHHVAIHYPVSMRERLYGIVIGPFIILALLYVLYSTLPILEPSGTPLSFGTIFLAVLMSLLRLFVAYVFAVVIAMPLAILVVINKTVESILLPLFDILQSFPFLAFFPVVIALFIRLGFQNGPAIFILFLAMVWNIVFTVVGGLKLIPQDVISAARVFGLSGWRYVWRLLLPASFPQFVTGSILAIAQGWNILIVAEVLHTYIPGGTESDDLFGIGSVMVHASTSAQNGVFLLSILAIIIVIGVFNFFVWQKLLHYSQRFRFE